MDVKTSTMQITALVTNDQIYFYITDLIQIRSGIYSSAVSIKTASSLVTRAQPKGLDWIYFLEGVLILDTACLQIAAYQTLF